MADVGFKEGTFSVFKEGSVSTNNFYHTTDDDQVHLGRISLTSPNIKAYQWTSVAGYAPDYTYKWSYSSLGSSTRKIFTRAIGFISGYAGATIGAWYFERSSSSLGVYVTVDNLISTSSAPSESVPIYVIYCDL